MDNRYNLYNLEASFKDYLLAGIDKTRINTNNNIIHELTRKELKRVSVKNYLSDLRHFLGWLIFKFKVQSSKFKVEEINASEFVQQISSELIEEYKSYLGENKIPPKTINRRLSTVRKFCSFCISQGWMKENPAKKVTNVIARSDSDEAISKRDRFANARDDILQQFKQHLAKENLDQKTITNYLDDIQEFLQV